MQHPDIHAEIMPSPNESIANGSTSTSPARATGVLGELTSVFAALTTTIDLAFEEIGALRAELADLKRAKDPTLLSAGQVEQLLGITAPTRRELTLRGELPVVYIDSRPKFRKTDVEALIERKASS